MSSPIGRVEFSRRESCPCCWSEDSQEICRYPLSTPPVRDYLERHYGEMVEWSSLDGANYEVTECRECGLIYQSSVPVGRLLASIYERWIPPSERRRLHEGYSLKDYRYWAGQVDFLVQYFGGRPSEVSVLDFGIGWAEWATLARGYGCNVAGVEISQERKSYAKSVGIQILEWDQIPSRSFDFINTEQVFEHLIEPMDTLLHLVRALRPNGLIKISVPDGRGIKRPLHRLCKSGEWPGACLMPIAPLEHVNCFTYASLVAFAQRCGLKPVRPRLWRLLNASSGWLEPIGALRLVLRSLYRHVYPKSTFVYFTLRDEVTS